MLEVGVGVDNVPLMFRIFFHGSQPRPSTSLTAWDRPKSMTHRNNEMIPLRTSTAMVPLITSFLPVQVTFFSSALISLKNLVTCCGSAIFSISIPDLSISLAGQEGL